MLRKYPKRYPCKLAQKIVEHRELSMKKGLKHFRDCLGKCNVMWISLKSEKNLHFYKYKYELQILLAKCLKKLSHCGSNLQRNKNVILPVITKFLKLVSESYKMFSDHTITIYHHHRWYRCNSKAKSYRRRPTLTLLILLIKPYKAFISTEQFPALHKIAIK